MDAQTLRALLQKAWNNGYNTADAEYRYLEKTENRLEKEWRAFLDAAIQEYAQ